METGRTRNLISGILQAVMQRLPTTCALCGEPGASGLSLCRPCRNELPWNRLACVACAEPLTSQTEWCARCLRRPPPFTRSWVPLLYADPVDHLITGLKFNGKLAYAQVLAQLLAEHAPDETASCIVPVPLHRNRLRARGFNQALELVRPLGRRMGLPVDWRAVRRTRMTVAQSGLPAGRRSGNVTGAFTAQRRFDGERVVLFDDVVTTGHTAAELARCLRRAGAAEVLLWACARAPALHR